MDYWIGPGESDWKVSVADNGDVLIVYEGAHRDGSGEFSCRYNILPAIEKMFADIERRVDDLTFDAPREDGAGMGKVVLKKLYGGEDRQRITEAAVKFSAIVLIGHFALKFVATMPEAIDDVLLVAEAGVRSIIAKALDDAAIPYTPPNLRPAIKRRADESAARRARQLGELLRTWAHVQLEAARGRPVKASKAGLLAAIAARQKAGAVVSPAAIAEDLEADDSTVREALKLHNIELENGNK